MAKYDYIEGELLRPDGTRTGVKSRVRVRVDRRRPTDILREVQRAVRRARNVLDGVRSTGLLEAEGAAPNESVLTTSYVQRELGRDIDDLIKAAQAARRALKHTRDESPPRVVEQAALDAPGVDTERT